MRKRKNELQKIIDILPFASRSHVKTKYLDDPAKLKIFLYKIAFLGTYSFGEKKRHTLNAFTFIEKKNITTQCSRDKKSLKK